MAGELKKGDVIHTANIDDCIETMKQLSRAGVDTDFLYEHKGISGYFLEVTDVREDRS